MKVVLNKCFGGFELSMEAILELVKMDSDIIKKTKLEDEKKRHPDFETCLVDFKEGYKKDSLFCEWGYIVNLDTMMLEVWRGFQKRPQQNNRFGVEPNEDDYYPCRLIRQYDLSFLPTDKELKEIEEQE